MLGEGDADLFEGGDSDTQNHTRGNAGEDGYRDQVVLCKPRTTKVPAASNAGPGGRSGPDSPSQLSEGAAQLPP
jgi:hypothetical protein